MIDGFLTWLILGFIIALFIRLSYVAPNSGSFSGSIFLGTMGAASGEALSKILSFGTSSYISPLVYMLCGATLLIIWSLNSKVAS